MESLQAFGGEFAGGRLALIASEIPSEPGGVGARTIPFGAGRGAEEMAERFAAVAENGGRREAGCGGAWAKRAGLGRQQLPGWQAGPKLSGTNLIRVSLNPILETESRNSKLVGMARN